MQARQIDSAVMNKLREQTINALLENVVSLDNEGWAMMITAAIQIACTFAVKEPAGRFPLSRLQDMLQYWHLEYVNAQLARNASDGRKPEAGG